jgi:hemerythrin-like metal-binding protein
MLCAYINTLARTLSRGKLPELGADIAANLRSYTASHFHTEEQYFSRSGYKETEKHKEVHARFVAKVVEVERQFAAGVFDGGEDLLDFLKKWLLNHIRITDHQYVPFVKSMLAARGGSAQRGGAGAVKKK